MTLDLGISLVSICIVSAPLAIEEPETEPLPPEGENPDPRTQPNNEEDHNQMSSFSRRLRQRASLPPITVLESDTFENILLATEAIARWSVQARAEGHELGTLAGYIDNTDQERVTAKLATRADFRRFALQEDLHDPILDALEQPDAGGELRLLMIEGENGFTTLLSVVLPQAREQLALLQLGNGVQNGG